jgi:hypothetical protein
VPRQSFFVPLHRRKQGVQRRDVRKLLGHIGQRDLLNCHKNVQIMMAPNRSVNGRGRDGKPGARILSRE